MLLIAAISSLLGHGPFAGDPGTRWYATKILIYALLLVIGLKLRFVMREWTVMFRILAVEPDNVEVENRLEKSIRTARMFAYLYWIGIAKCRVPWCNQTLFLSGHVGPKTRQLPEGWERLLQTGDGADTRRLNAVAGFVLAGCVI